MGRRVDVDQLVGAVEIARRAGVKRPQVVHVWLERHPEFPRPVVELQSERGTRRGALVWHWPDVEKWLRKTNRL